MKSICSKIFLSALLFFILLPEMTMGATGKGMSTTYTLEADGLMRSYQLYCPPSLGHSKVPLMIVLHGGLGNAASIEKHTGMDEIADLGKFIVAYPEGTGGRRWIMRNRRTWNAGRCCGQAVRQGSNDVLFIEKVIEDISAKFPIDTKRVYVTGMSNGAMMTYRLACEIPEKIAAIIPVSGTLALDTCDRAKDIPVLHIHGDQDRNVPFSGGRGELGVSGVVHRSVPETIEILTKPRQCADREEKILDGGDRHIVYNCREGAPVELLIIKNGGHTWPGGQSRMYRATSSGGISASRKAWEFARQFQK